VAEAGGTLTVAASPAPLSTTPPVLAELDAPVAERPGCAFAATADTPAVAASAPTIDHLVTREMRERPSSRREAAVIRPTLPGRAENPRKIRVNV
jgi:hypothetical protein